MNWSLKGASYLLEKDDHVITNDASDHEGDRRIEPVMTTGDNDDHAGYGGSGRGGGVGNGVEQDGPHVGAIAVVVVKFRRVTLKNQGANQHGNGRRRTRDHYGKPMNVTGPGRETVHALHDDENHYQQKQGSVEECRDRGGLRVPMGSSDGCRTAAEHDREEAHPDSDGVGEVVACGREYAEGVSNHTDGDQSSDEGQVEAEDDG